MLSDRTMIAAHKGYPYVLTMEDTATFRNYVSRLYSEISCGEHVGSVTNHTEQQKNSGGFAHIISGEYSIEGVSFYLQNCSTDSKKLYILFFRNREDTWKMFSGMKQRIKEVFPIPSQPLGTIPVYEFNGSWCKRKDIQTNDLHKLVGYQSHLTSIISHITIHKANSEKLARIGECKSLNFVLHGPPGVGKTTLIRTLASEMNLPLYMVKPQSVHLSSMSKVMSPSGDMTLLVFEDFDRFLNSTGGGNISDMLNALDGIDDSSNVIRIFTGNNYAVMSKFPALINRMSGIYPFHYPTVEELMSKLKWLTEGLELPDIDESDGRWNQFMHRLDCIDGLTLRPFTSYCIRYLLDQGGNGGEEGKDYLDRLLENVDELKTVP